MPDDVTATPIGLPLSTVAARVFAERMADHAEHALKRAGWECARDLLEHWRDRLDPHQYERALSASRRSPDDLHLAQAASLVRLHDRVAERKAR